MQVPPRSATPPHVTAGPSQPKADLRWATPQPQRSPSWVRVVAPNANTIEAVFAHVAELRSEKTALLADRAVWEDERSKLTVSNADLRDEVFEQKRRIDEIANQLREMQDFLRLRSDAKGGTPRAPRAATNCVPEHFDLTDDSRSHQRNDQGIEPVATNSPVDVAACSDGTGSSADGSPRLVTPPLSPASLCAGTSRIQDDTLVQLDTCKTLAKIYDSRSEGINHIVELDSVLSKRAENPLFAARGTQAPETEEEETEDNEEDELDEEIHVQPEGRNEVMDPEFDETPSDGALMLISPEYADAEVSGEGDDKEDLRGCDWLESQQLRAVCNEKDTYETASVEFGARPPLTDIPQRCDIV